MEQLLLRYARIYPWRKMHRFHAPSIAPGAFFVAQSWADCTTNMPGFNLPAHFRLLTGRKSHRLHRPAACSCRRPPEMRTQAFRHAASRSRLNARDKYR
ncbi:hypothetical protein SAMN05443247_11552 [Bradyrhizobium erythrophlei]|nr:hypothetical protein SAMN05443247_11552 [Bradyrhizobium erythrophlei]